MQTLIDHHPYGSTTAMEIGYILDDFDKEFIAESLGITRTELEENEELYQADIDKYAMDYDEMMEERAVDRLIDTTNL